MSRTVKVSGRVTATRAVLLGLAWVYYAALVLPLQAVWFLIRRYAFEDETATFGPIWKPNFRKTRRVSVDRYGNRQPSLAADVAGLGLFGWKYAALRHLRR